jgi:uncharacterized protein YndB with AHSA1/START domain
VRALTAERRWRSNQPGEQVWSTVLDFSAYPTWWPFLISFDPPPLEPGASTEAVVRAPAGYRLRLELELTEVDAPRKVVIAVDGDVIGESTVTVVSVDGGSEVGLHWSLAPRRRLLRTLGVVAGPVLVRGHDRILDDGFRRCLEATGLDLIPIPR